MSVPGAERSSNRLERTGSTPVGPAECTCDVEKEHTALMTDAVDDELTRFREAYAHHEWKLAFDLLKSVDASRPLSAEDLESLAWTARWTGRYSEGRR
jgi:hypothetical protein